MRKLFNLDGEVSLNENLCSEEPFDVTKLLIHPNFKRDSRNKTWRVFSKKDLINLKKY